MLVWPVFFACLDPRVERSMALTICAFVCVCVCALLIFYRVSSSYVKHAELDVAKKKKKFKHTYEGVIN